MSDDHVASEEAVVEQSSQERATHDALAVVAGGVRDPLGILEQQNASRVPWLVPLRRERMAQSPFAFYRGTAAIMAADQARDPHSGVLVASCGDAHVSNFGFYASPQRTLLFDLNDFDEAAWAPWEWDLKRLVTSVIIGGRASNRDETAVQGAAKAATKAYVRTLRRAVELSPLERYFAHLDPVGARAHLDRSSRKALDGAMKDARKRTASRAVSKLTVKQDGGHRHFTENPPLTTHLEPELRGRVANDYDQYLSSANVDVRALLTQYSVDDVARRVVGVGSVGTRCYLTLLRDDQAGIFILQVKEAGASVLEEFGRVPQPEALVQTVESGGQGARVVGLQRILQAYSDPFLGSLRSGGTDYYVRQFHDMKGSIEVEGLKDGPFLRYVATCAAILARAHAQSDTAAEVVAYIGGGKQVRRSVLAWANAYAEVSLDDYRAFADEVGSGLHSNP